jgi:hypothetical protein
LQEELQNSANDLREAGFTSDTIREAMGMQYEMLKKLGVPFTEITIE